ncbi:MAG: hypothetical protein FVQ81_18300 [Candidatus Glassbacteria bacterium]|nr:hypothetical protein [Candidatus Glassbacteria bacterium]
MVKVSGPMFSLAASGSLAKTITFATWKGRPYARELVTPANPKSGLQTGMRSMFGFLSQYWTNVSAASQTSWDAQAEQITASGFNAYMRFNQRLWRNFLAPTKDSGHGQVGTLATVPILALTAGVRSIQVDFSVTIPNENWGVLIFRDLTTAFTPALSNCIKILRVETAFLSASFLDSPLVPDDYFYNAILFTADGVLGTAVGEQTATVT